MIKLHNHSLFYIIMYTKLSEMTVCNILFINQNLHKLFPNQVCYKLKRHSLKLYFM